MILTYRDVALFCVNNLYRNKFSHILWPYNNKNLIQQMDKSPSSDI